ncbi:MAG: FMN-binding negative transcriptional regulator [Burkholderiales bacterium]|nr:FMN-binding negative transcriptional regulator [Burkholderiales bacterium]
MYLPKHFEQNDAAALAALMRAHPLATLVTVTNGALSADHLPLQYDASTRTLRGHVARANPLWRDAAGTAVLALFHGPQGYVSPNWYPSKAEHHKAVPTWNYAVVHAHGRLRAVDDAAWVHALVSELTARHEAGRTPPWQVADAPADYLQQMLGAIVGIEITIERLVGKWKLSQNRSEADRLGAAAGVDDAALAALMKGA